MQEQFSELSRKYREEMLRMYGTKKPTPVTEPEISTIPEPIVENQPRSAEPMPIPELSTIPDPIVENQPRPAEPMPLPEPMPQLTPQAQPPIEPENNSAFTGMQGDFQNRLETPFSEQYELPELPDYIQNGEPPVMEQDAADEMLDLTELGFLRVAARTGDGAFPVEGASVTIAVRRNGTERLAYHLLTDDSGETPTVSMPAPPASLSQTPEDAQPFTIVDIRIFANGYFRAEMLNVPIFAGVTSLQTFQLIPLPILMHEDMETLSVSTESPDL